MKAEIRRHRLWLDGAPVAFAATPNRRPGLAPRYLVMHYTAGASAKSAIMTLTDPAAKASAHLVVDRDGTTTQLVGFDEIAWHAGESRWEGLVGLNAFSIGIELVNAGPLDRVAGRWRSWFGTTYPDAEVMEAAHRNDPGRTRGWLVYPPRQLAAAIAIGRAQVAAYTLRGVVGHDDIAPGRKQDPGPAFPMDGYRGAVMGRGDDAPQRYEVVNVTSGLRFRAGPGTDAALLRESPLKRGTNLHLLRRDGAWCYVEVLNAAGRPAATGWVHGDYIAPLA